MDFQSMSQDRVFFLVNLFVLIDENFFPLIDNFHAKQLAAPHFSLYKVFLPMHSTYYYLVFGLDIFV